MPVVPQSDLDVDAQKQAQLMAAQNQAAYRQISDALDRHAAKLQNDDLYQQFSNGVDSNLERARQYEQVSSGVDSQLAAIQNTPDAPIPEPDPFSYEGFSKAVDQHLQNAGGSQPTPSGGTPAQVGSFASGVSAPSGSSGYQGGLGFNGTYYQDPNFDHNVQRYGAEVAKYLGPQAGRFAMAQAREETGNGQSMSTPYNYGNVGNTDSNPKGGGQYGSPEEAARAWVNFITNNGGPTRYQDFINKAQQGADIPTLAASIKAAGYATDPNYAAKIASIASRTGAGDLVQRGPAPPMEQLPNATSDMPGPAQPLGTLAELDPSAAIAASGNDLSSPPSTQEDEEQANADVTSGLTQPVDIGPSPSDQQTPIAQYNEEAPGGLGAFRQVTKMAGGNYQVQPTAQPSPEQEAAYQQQEHASQGFTDNAGSVPQLAATTAAAPQPMPLPAPPQATVTDLVGPRPANVQPAPTASTGNPIADAFHTIGDFFAGRGMAFQQGAQQAMNRDVGTDMTGNQGFGQDVQDVGNYIAGGVAGALGAKGSESLPPDTIAPGHLEDPYTNTGLSKVPVVGGLIPAALNPSTYAPIPGSAEVRAAGALETGLRDVGQAAEHAAPEAESAVGRAFNASAVPLMGGGAPLAAPTSDVGKLVAQAVAADPQAIAETAAFNAKPASVPMAQKLRNLGTNIQRAMVDANIDINQVGPKSETAAANMAGASSAAAQAVEEGLRPVYQTLGTDPAIEEQYNRYVGLQNALERAQAFGGTRNAPAGINSVADAQAALARFQAQMPQPVMDSIQQADLQRVSALRNLLQEKVRSGFLTQDVADGLVEKYPHYNPVTILQAVQEGTGATGGRALTQIGNTIKRLTAQGSDLDQLPALQSTALSLAGGTQAIMRNDAIKTIVQEAGVPVRRAVQAITRPVAASPEDLTTVLTGVPKDEPGMVSFWDGGKRFQADFSQTPALAKALQGLNATQTNFLMQAAQAMNAPLRAGATALSPPFLIRNAFFDALDAYLRLGIRPTDVVRGYISAATKDPTYREAIAHGAGMGGFFMRESPVTGLLREAGTAGPEQVAKRAQQLTNMAKDSGGWMPTTPTAGLKFLKNLATLEPIRQVGEIIEQGPRIAAYKQAIARGQSAADAALAFRRSTVDFSRMGTVMRQVNAIIPFSNAALQGTLNIGRSLATSPAARLRIAALTTGLAGLEAWNRQIPEYADVPEYVKANSLVVMLPGSVPNPNGQPGYKEIHYIALPVRELGALPYLFSQVLGGHLGTKANGWQTLGDALGMASSVVSPVSSESVLAPVPAPLKAGLQQAANYDIFRGRPIVSQSLESLPTSEQFTPQTTETAKFIGQKLGIAPVRVDQAIYDTTAGLGRTVTGAIDTAVARKPSDTPPVVGGLVGGTYRTYGGQVLNDLYTQRDRLVNQLEPDVTQQVKSSPEYQNATPDRQQAMLRSAKADLQQTVTDGLGLTKPNRDLGLPQKYYMAPAGSALEREIDQARSHVAAYRANRSQVTVPSPREFALAAANTTYKYQQATKQQRSQNAQIKSGVGNLVGRFIAP